MWPDLQERVLYTHHFRTQISTPFYGYIIRQSMCACFVANSSPVCFSWGCHVRRPWMPGLYSVVSVGCSTKATRLWSLTRPCSDIIYRFNYFLGKFKHQWIHKTSVTTQRMFSPPLRGSPPRPTNHPYVFTCGTGKKLSKMAGNSASKPSKRAPAELPCITRLVEKLVYEAPCILETQYFKTKFLGIYKCAYKTPFCKSGHKY